MKQAIHKHHIVPKYKCKELGIDPDFDDNFVEVTRLQHANIHWGYWCKDLSVLLEVCSPPQYVIDMIPLGDKRDIPAAQLLAEGEIDGIDMSGENHPRGMLGKKHSEENRKKMSENTSGENNPNFKHGNAVGLSSPDKEVRKRAKKELYAKNRDEICAKRRERYVRLEKPRKVKKKLERQGVGILPIE